MSPTTNLSPILAAILLLLTIGEVESEKCCREKRVGSISYTLDHGLHSLGKCLNNCVYTVTGSSRPKFCFQKGDLPTECLSGKPGSTSGTGTPPTPDCEGPLKPEVVQSIDGIGGDYPASSVLILGEEDAKMDDDKFNFWLAQHQATEGQGFTMRLDNCARLIGGFQIKNKGEGDNIWWGTKDFRVSGSRDENGPWETLAEDQLVDTTGGKPASLLNFTFKDPVTIKYIKFELVSFWGTNGGGLQYFAAIPATRASAALACTAGTTLGENLATAFGNCSSNNSFATMRKVVKKLQLSRNEEQCYSHAEIMEWVLEEFADDACVLKTIGWTNDNFDFNEGAIMSDLTSLDPAVTAPIFFEGNEDCVAEVMDYVENHECASTFTEEEQDSLLDTAKKIATYECLLHFFEQGCMEFLDPVGRE